LSNSGHDLSVARVAVLADLAEEVALARSEVVRE
jgi:hypothetical protein